MSQTINIQEGISTIGNPTDRDELISDLNITGIKSFKTLANGLWNSWTLGAPEAFQGFLELERGMGYVVNAETASDIILSGSDLDVNNINYNIGLNMLCFPFEGRSIGNGYVPRIKLSSLKQFENNWKSWTEGTPDNLQGFLNLNKSKGYVCNISEIIDESYLNINLQNKSEGVRFNTNDTIVSNNEFSEGVRYTDPNGIGSLSFDKEAYDSTVPTIIMFIEINGSIAKIEYPSELEGKSFFIPNNSSLFTGIFAENEDYTTPTVIMSTITSSDLELSYTSKIVDLATAEFKEMVIKYDSVEAIIEYANTYEGEELKIWYNGKIGTTVFSEGTTNVTIA